MATNVIMPALGMAQERGRLVRWLAEPGAAVNKGDPLMEVETDKTTVEIEAPATGILAQVSAQAGTDVPVAQVIAVILAPGESGTVANVSPAASTVPAAPQLPSGALPIGTRPPASQPPSGPLPTGTAPASPLAVRVAAEHDVDLRLVTPQGLRIEKADVLAYVEAQAAPAAPAPSRRVLASPKARRLAAEQGLALAALQGSGPDGAIQTADVLAAAARPAVASPAPAVLPPMPAPAPEHAAPAATAETVSTLWRVMAERVTQSWTTVPHFYLVREVNAAGLLAWHAGLGQRSPQKITITDLLTRIVAEALARHPRANASWRDGALVAGSGIHIGLAVAVEGGLVVPVIHDAGRLGLREIAASRQDLTARAQAGKLRTEEMAGGTFTISNLGMYGVDAFNAIVNPPQAALLAVGRIADRVVAVDGRPAVRPTVILSLSCDHRVLDGARGAAFLKTVVGLIQEPIAILD